MITTVLFDLDGTLLPMDNKEFTQYYFSLLCKKVAPYGYESKSFIDAIWAGTYAMVKNDGSKSNEAVFWETFAGLLGSRVYKIRSVIEDFYRNDFNAAKAVCGYDTDLVQLITDLKANGYRIVLATNPLFPSFATENRIRWAGFQPEDFLLYTTYENIGYCKPNPAYYAEILNRIQIPAEECLMVGNDVAEDMIAGTLGMDVFLLTRDLINSKNADISVYAHGGAAELRAKLMPKQ